MTQHEYCPTCWPADAGNYKRGRCLNCAGHTAMANTEEYLNLVLQQNAELTAAFAECMNALIEAGLYERGKPKPPALRVIQGRKH